MTKSVCQTLGKVAAVTIAALGLYGCATNSQDAPTNTAISDPIEPVNRVVFAFNGALDAVFLRHAAGWYRDITPREVKDSVHNFVLNLKAPLTFLHDLAQLEEERAFVTAQRFVINSTLGIAGILDVATGLGIDPYHQEDAGQTLAVWGVPEGPYLVLPVFGPSNLRDATGRVIDHFIDPVTALAKKSGEKDIGRSVAVTRDGLGALSARAGALETLDGIERTSLDYYAAIRSLYRQRRKDQIRNGADVAASQADAPDPVEAENASFDFDDVKP